MPTTILLQDTCETCHGTGVIPQRREPLAGGFQVTLSGSCGACLNTDGPAGFHERRVTLEELRVLLLEDEH